MWKRGKPKSGFPLFPRTLGNRKTGDSHISTAAAIITLSDQAKSKTQNTPAGHGKVEIQRQDSHCSTASTACGSKVKKRF